MIPLPEALKKVLAQASALEAVRVPCAEAGGAWLQEDVFSDVDQPPADVSAMDGFALRAADAAQVPAELAVVGESAAGAPAQVTVGQGQAVRIMTGAPVPVGADCVQMVEHTAEADGSVRILRPAEPGAHIRRRGENIRRGDLLLETGQRLGPAEVGLLAGAGKAMVAIGRPPTVGILPTGDELVEPAATPGPGQIRNSNGYSLQHQVRAEGALPFYLGIGRDQEPQLEEKLREGLGHDVLLICGGVSMGKYDLVKPVLSRLGVAIAFEKVAVKPGKPTVFGVYRAPGRRPCLVFGLPGNPVSAMVIFQLLVVPALRRLQGASRAVPPTLHAVITQPLHAAGGRACFLPARITWDGARFEAVPVSHHGSGDLVAWRRANGMIHLPAGSSAGPGEVVEVLLAGDHGLR